MTRLFFFIKNIRKHNKNTINKPLREWHVRQNLNRLRVCRFNETFEQIETLLEIIQIHFCVNVKISPALNRKGLVYCREINSKTCARKTDKVAFKEKLWNYNSLWKLEKTTCIKCIEFQFTRTRRKIFNVKRGHYGK